MNPSKKILNITGSALSRINSVIISARTVTTRGYCFDCLKGYFWEALLKIIRDSETTRKKKTKNSRFWGRGWHGGKESRQETRAERFTFWVWKPPGGVGVFHAKGWWPKSSCPPSKVCLPWVSKRGISDVPGILPGCPGSLGVFQKFVQKKFVRIFRSLFMLGSRAFLAGSLKTTSLTENSNIIFKAENSLKRFLGWRVNTKEIRRVKSTPDPDTFEKYRDTPPISIAILLQRYALFLAESRIYTTSLYHNTAPICIAILLQKY